jgi:uncharacterized peroxidase-related enzyme
VTTKEGDVPFLGSIAHDDKVPHVLGKFSAQGSTAGRPLIDFHQKLLRGDSPFTVQQRELMAAYVSGVNACRYCHGAHSAVAQLFGVPETVITGLVDDVDTAEVEDSMKPVFRYLRKLTETPTRATQADVDAILEAGWSERAVYDAVLVCCLYNFMNRFVEGLGLTPIPEHFPVEGQMIADGGYDGMLDAFGIL